MLALLRETVATQPDAVAGLLAAMRAGPGGPTPSCCSM